MGIQTCERKSNCSDLNSIALRAVKRLKSQSIEHNQVVRVGSASISQIGQARSHTGTVNSLSGRSIFLFDS